METDEIRRMTEKCFPGSTLIRSRELTEGLFNAAYEVFGDGPLAAGAVLKTGPAPGTKILTYEKEIMKAEVEVYRLLEQTDVPVPKVLASDFSRETTDGDYFFMSRLEGELWKNADKKKRAAFRPQLMKELGACNAAIHSIRGSWFGYLKEDAHYRYDTWYEAFYGMMDDILEDGRRDGHELPGEEIRAVVRRCRKALEKVKEPRLVDYDIWAGNIFVKPSGDGLTISGIIDFERSFYGDPYADFTSAMELFQDVEKEPEFEEGYRTVSGGAILVGEEERIRMDLYRLYMAVIMCVETYRYDKLHAGLIKIYCKMKIKEQLKKLARV